MSTLAAIESSTDFPQERLDDELRVAVRGVMASEKVSDKEVAKVQEILDRRAALMRATFAEKLRRVKATA